MACVKTIKAIVDRVGSGSKKETKRLTAKSVQNEDHFIVCSLYRPGAEIDSRTHSLTHPTYLYMRWPRETNVAARRGKGGGGNRWRLSNGRKEGAPCLSRFVELE